MYFMLSFDDVSHTTIERTHSIYHVHVGYYAGVKCASWRHQLLRDIEYVITMLYCKR